MNVELRKLTVQDLPDAERLREAAGWNQLTSDWQRVIRYQPDGCFAAESDGTVLGTVTTTSYETQVAWIGMMLVHPDCRRRGIATELMTRALDYLQAENIGCIRLDATPAGQPVYEKIGFQAEWMFHRWHRKGAGTTGPVPDRSAFVANNAYETDLRAFGVCRRRWLDLLAADSAVVADGPAFGMIRDGRMSAYLGPVSAPDSAAAEPVVLQLLQQTDRDVFWDIPSPNKEAVAMAEAMGFLPVRDLMRMRTGRTQLNPDLSQQFALSDPGTG